MGIENSLPRRCVVRYAVTSATRLFETRDSEPAKRPYPITLNFYLEEEQWRVDLSGLGHP
jgi:hypothetical protein